MSSHQNSLNSLKNLVTCCTFSPLKLSENERDMFRRYKKLLDDKNTCYRFEELKGEGGEGEDKGEGEGITETEVETLLSAVDISFIPSFVLLFQVLLFIYYLLIFYYFIIFYILYFIFYYIFTQFFLFMFNYRLPSHFHHKIPTNTACDRLLISKQGSLSFMFFFYIFFRPMIYFFVLPF